MSNVFFILTLISMALVLISLVAGLVVMGRGGDANKKRSNALMRARVMLQGVAIVFFILAMSTA